MSNIEDFLTAKDEEEIVEAIRVAECDTSGEIRVHIEQNCDIDVYERALDVFHVLKMDNTKAQNGVLIYVAVDNKDVEARWRGIGIRIEDDVLVTKTGHHVLTHAVVKEIDDIEALMAGE